MQRNGLVLTLGLALAASGCAATTQPPSTQLAGARCGAVSDVESKVAALYTPGNVDRVEPLYRTQRFARSTEMRYVAGATLYMPAEQGMTASYLERVLSCHAVAQSDTHPNDPLRVANVRNVAVATRGQHLVVNIEGADREAGSAILARARALGHASDSVQVHQLSAAPRARQAL